MSPLNCSAVGQETDRIDGRTVPKMFVVEEGPRVVRERFVRIGNAALLWDQRAYRRVDGAVNWLRWSSGRHRTGRVAYQMLY
jgi:PAS domain S-box-containing protein